MINKKEAIKAINYQKDCLRGLTVKEISVFFFQSNSIIRLIFGEGSDELEDFNKFDTKLIFQCLSQQSAEQSLNDLKERLMLYFDKCIDSISKKHKKE